MIAIVNVQNCGPYCNGTEPHKYEVRINDEVITTFKHNREEGLSVCLSKAAHAVLLKEESTEPKPVSEIAGGVGCAHCHKKYRNVSDLRRHTCLK